MLHQPKDRPVLGPAFTVVPSAEPDLRRKIAAQAFQPATSFVSATAFQRAAKVMGREIHEETWSALMALSCSYYDQLTPEVREWLARVKAAILK